MQECYLCGIKYTTLYFLMIVAEQKWKRHQKRSCSWCAGFVVSLKELMSCIRQGRPETQLWRPHWVVRHALNLIFGCHDPDMVLQFPGLSYTSISCLALLAGQIPPYHYLALSLQPGWVVSCNRREKKNNRIAVKGTERNREINAGGRLVAFLKTISCNISTCALCVAVVQL